MPIPKNLRSGGTGRKGGWGERNSRPALVFSPPQFFAFRFAKYTTENLFFIIFNFWCSIKIIERKYHLYFNSTTTILVCQT